MTAIKYKKEKISSTVSPYIRKRVEEFVEAEEFSSVSDFVSTALAEFIGKLDHQKELEKAKSTTEAEKELERHDKLLLKVIEYAFSDPEKLKEFLDFQLEKLDSKSKSTEEEKPDRVTHPSRKEQSLAKICPDPRELTPEETRKAAEAKRYYKKLLGDEGEDDLPSTMKSKVVIE